MPGYRGKVSGYTSRVESPEVRRRTTLVWNFRIERHDDRGRPLPRVAIEMRGKQFRGGSINNGDVVECTGTPNRHGLVAVRQVKNLTAGTVVSAQVYNPLFVIGLVLQIVFGLLALSCVGTVAYMILTEGNW